MDFLNYKCPVCNEQFKSGDDIVVCPECGAPHHRNCYEENEHCFYEDKHKEGFSFEDAEFEESSDEESNEGVVICPNCSAENPKEMFYCNKCGFPLNERDRKNNNNQNQNTNNAPPFGQNMPPFGFGGTGNPFDPMAGIKNDEPIADGVTAGEMSKFVGKNTPYYMLVFNKINKFSSSRFNFSAFLFSGVYFLYRKLTAIGIILSLLMIAINVATTYIQLMPEYQNLVSTITNTPNGAQMFYSFTLTSYGGISLNDALFLYLPYALSLVRFIIMLVCGFVANRMYYKHCTKKIKSLKSKKESVNLNNELETSGGVNLPLAISFAVVFVLVMYIPLFFNFTL